MNSFKNNKKREISLPSSLFLVERSKSFRFGEPLERDVDKFYRKSSSRRFQLISDSWKQFKIGTRGIPRECEKECLICIKILARRGQIIEKIFRFPSSSSSSFDFQLKLKRREGTRMDERKRGGNESVGAKVWKVNTRV